MLLWPAWAFRVLAPKVEAPEVNLFQHLVLRLLRAGIADVHEMARHLRIEVDLAAHVAAEVQQNGWVDARFVPTAQGLEVLQEGEAPAAFELQVVFVDACSGRPFPRVLSYEAFVERRAALSITEKGGWKLDVPRRDAVGSLVEANVRVYPVPPTLQNSTMVPAPDSERVYQAGQSHAAARRAAHFVASHGRGQESSDEEAPQGDAPQEASGSAIERIERVDGTGVPVWLLTRLDGLMPASMAEEIGEVVSVADPFGLDPYPWLNVALEKQLEARPTGTSHPWAARIGRERAQRSQEEALSRLPEDRKRELDRWTAAAAVAAQKLGRAPGSDPLWRQYVELQLAFDGAVLAPPSRIESSLKRVVTLAAQVVEGVLRRCLDPYLSGLPVSAGGGRDSFLNEYLPAAALAVGFSERSRASIPRGNYTKSPRGLAALLAMNLVAADRNSSHPLRAAAAARPALLEDLDALRRDRNTNSDVHYVEGGGQTLSLDRAERYVETAYALAQLLLL